MIEIITVLLVFGIPLSAIWTNHQQRMLKMKMQMHEQSGVNDHSSIEALRKEVLALRDTTTQYDLSFDAALQRLEQRVNGLERRNLAPHEETFLELGDRR